MFTQKTKSIVQKFTVLLMLFSLIQTSWASLNHKVSHIDLNKERIAYSNFDTPANYYDTIDEEESNILNINNYYNSENAQPGAVNLNQSVKITDSKTKINLSLRDSDVKQVLRMFAQKAGMNVIFHNSVDGRVTLDLVDITLNDAFLLVLRSAELTYILDDKNIIVASNAQANSLSFAKQSLTIIPVKYERAQNISDFLNNNIFGAKITGLSGDKIVTANPATNEIMLFGTQNDVDVASKIIEKLDRKPMINTFKVNHTTPREMAMLLCNTFIETNKEVSTEEEDDMADDDDDDDSDSDDDDEVKKVKLGSGIVACRATEDIVFGNNNSSGGGGSSGNRGAGETSLTLFNSAPISIVYFPELGTINVNGGSIEQVKVIKEFIKQNDKKQPMAYVEMSVVELNESGSKEFANEWSLWTPFLSLNFDTSQGLSTNANRPTFFTGNNYEVFDSKDPSTGPKYTVDKYRGDSTLVYRLKYLVQNGKGRVLTNPKIMVTNGQKSVIDMTSDYVKTVKSELITTIDNAGYSRNYEIGDDEGLKIELVPFISPDGYVSLNITPEFATVKERIYAPGQSGEEELQATLLQRRDLSLKNIRIKDGETLVLAGLIKENETQQVTKIPILGDLPVIGVFFRSSTSQKSKEELVIMITPHIVYSSEDIADIKSIDL